MQSDRFEEWRALWRDSIALRRADGRSPVAASAAGRPALPSSVEWPRDEYERPLQYLMAFDLAALPRIGIDLPDEGALLFFIDDEHEAPVVMFFEDTGGHLPRDHPDDFDRTRPERIDLMAVLEPSRPGTDHPYLTAWPEGHFAGLDKVLATEIDYPEPPNEGDHRIGGHYAVGIQYDFPCAPASTLPDLPGAPDPEALELPILLARMDYDPDAGMGWGDCGSAEWTISRDDLAARRFDRVEFSWSCY